MVFGLWQDSWLDEWGPKIARYTVVKETKNFIYVDAANPEPKLFWRDQIRLRYGSKTARFDKRKFNGYYYQNRSHKLNLFETKAAAEAFEATYGLHSFDDFGRALKNIFSLDTTEAKNLLGLKPDYSQSDLKSAYRKMARETHPDHGGTGFEEVNAAYQILKLYT